MGSGKGLGDGVVEEPPFTVIDGVGGAEMRFVSFAGLGYSYFINFLLQLCYVIDSQSSRDT